MGSGNGEPRHYHCTKERANSLREKKKNSGGKGKISVLGKKESLYAPLAALKDGDFKLALSFRESTVP